MIRPCPVCKSDKYKLIFRDKNRREGLDIEADFVKCTHCGMKYLTNIPEFEKFRNAYEDIYENENFSVNPDIKSNGKKVLDVGCSFGGQLKKYYEEGYEIYGVDLNDKAIKDAKKNIPKGTFKNCLLEDSGFPDNYFDVIRTSHVLEHVYNIDSFLEEVLRILSPKGEFIIKVPNGNSLEMDIFKKYSSQSWIPFHINLFSPHTIKHKLINTGFKQINVQTKATPWWWILSFRQFKNTINKEKNLTNFNRSIFDKLIMMILYPIVFIPSLFGKGDELIVKAKK